MSWIALTEARLLTRLSGRELEKMRAAALADAQADPVQEAFDQVTRKVRSRMPAGWPKGPAGTIPDEMLDDALALCVVKVMTRPGGIMIDPEGQRASDARTAEENLDKLAKGLIQIEAPPDEDVSDEEPSAPEEGQFGGNPRIRMRTDPVEEE
jgi:hypothetical protein